MDLTKGKILTLFKKIAIPASVGTFFQTMYNIVDTYFAGKISPEALSAIAKSFPIAGKAIFTEDPMKGTKNAANIAIIRATFLSGV